MGGQVAPTLWSSAFSQLIGRSGLRALTCPTLAQELGPALPKAAPDMQSIFQNLKGGQMHTNLPPSDQFHSILHPPSQISQHSNEGSKQLVLSILRQNAQKVTTVSLER